jgi:hypothetical protein
MKWSLLPLMMVMLSAGCQRNQPSAALKPLAGSYYRGNGLGYNIRLNLRANGAYDATWRGCLGLYGTARGMWTVDGEQIVFSPTKETGNMKGHLKRLDVLQHEGRSIFVPSDDRQFYDAHGVSSYSCFQRTEAPK